MKKIKLIVAFVSVITLMFTFAACGSGEGNEESSVNAAPEKHQLAYPDGYDTTSAGASSYDGWCDDANSKYFKINDYYNMKSEGTLHILENFETYQQSTEYTCGPSSAYMVLNWFKGDTKKYDELTIAEMSDTSDTTGVGVDGLTKFFEEIGWHVDSYGDSAAGAFDDAEDPLLAFEEFCIENIDNGVPVMVDWIDWDGHWQVIIGIDTCQNDNSSDDVLILADPYDTSDQWQDGYYTFSAERFFYMWHEGACIGDAVPDINPYIVAMPQDKYKELNKQ